MQSEACTRSSLGLASFGCMQLTTQCLALVCLTSCVLCRQRRIESWHDHAPACCCCCWVVSQGRPHPRALPHAPSLCQVRTLSHPSWLSGATLVVQAKAVHSSVSQGVTTGNSFRPALGLVMLPGNPLSSAARLRAPDPAHLTHLLRWRPCSKLLDLVYLSLCPALHQAQFQALTAPLRA